MNAESGAMLVVVWIPLAVVWVYVMADLVRQRRLSPARKVVWAVACTVVWPALIAYLLTRPTSGRIVDPEQRSDPRAILVRAVLDHEDGRIDDAEMGRVSGDLRRSGR